MIEKGNIDLTKRPVVKNSDGSISTVRSMSFNDGRQEVLIPTVHDRGYIMSDDQAVEEYRKTGRHLGKFTTPDEATTYAQQLHKDQEKMYANPQKKKSLEEFLSFAPPARQEYVTAPEPEYQNGRPVMKKGSDGSATFKGKTGTLKKDSTGKEVAELQPIGVEAPKEEAQAPRPLKNLLPPVESAPPAAPQPQPAPAPAPQSPALQQSQGPSAWERFMVGATPALVGLLTGNPLEGTQLAGQTLAGTEADLYKRERDFNSKIAEMKAKKALAVTDKNERKPNFARQELFDPKTGKTYVHSIVDGQDVGALGEASPNKVKQSYISKVLRNPKTGAWEEAIIDPTTKEVNFVGEANVKKNRVIKDLSFQGKPTAAVVDMDNAKVESYLGDLPEKPNRFEGMEQGKNDRFRAQKMIDLTKEFAKPTGNFNKTKENLDGLVSAAEQLNMGNPRANAGIANYLARNVYGEKGPLSDSDIARLSGDPSYGAVVNRWLDAKLNGKLGELDRKDIRQILEISYKLQKEKAMSEADRFGKAFATTGFDPSPGVQAYVHQAIRPLPGHVELGRGHRSHPDLPVGTVQKGYKYKGGDPSKEENWEKQ